MNYHQQSHASNWKYKIIVFTFSGKRRFLYLLSIPEPMLNAHLDAIVVMGMLNKFLVIKERYEKYWLLLFHHCSTSIYSIKSKSNVGLSKYVSSLVLPVFVVA